MDRTIMHKLILLTVLILCCLAGCAQQTGTFTDSRDGQTYKTVTIGTQVWMAENLNYEILESWYYDDNPENGAVYGRLYTWEAAKKACPDCWHLPSEEEWVILERHLGMSEEEAAVFLLRGEGIGTKLKSKSGWEPVDGKNLGTNETGFNALPGGHRGYEENHSYELTGKRGAWWSSTPTGKYAFRRALYHDKSGIDRDPATRALGFSVRCVKD